MHSIQIILVIFFSFAIIKVIGRYRSQELSLRAFIMWVLFWVASAAVVIRPNGTAYFAELVGIGRGADLVVYCSIALVFFIIFRLMIKINQLERHITELTRATALKDVQKK